MGIKPIDAPMAKEGEIKSPRKWLSELYEGEAPPKPQKFIQADKRRFSKPTTEDQDLSKILEDALQEPISNPSEESTDQSEFKKQT